MSGHTSGPPVSRYVPGARHDLPVSVGSHATAVPCSNVGGKAGPLGADAGGAGTRLGPTVATGAGVVAAPTGPADPFAAALGLGLGAEVEHAVRRAAPATSVARVRVVR